MGKDHYIRTLPQDIPVISLDAIRRKYKVNPTDKAANGRVVQKAKEEARNWLIYSSLTGLKWRLFISKSRMRYGGNKIVNGNLWFRKRYWIQCSGSWKFRNWGRHMKWCILSDSRQDTSLFVYQLFHCINKGLSPWTKCIYQSKITICKVTIITCLTFFK